MATNFLHFFRSNEVSAKVAEFLDKYPLPAGCDRYAVLKDGVTLVAVDDRYYHQFGEGVKLPEPIIDAANLLPKGWQWAEEGRDVRGIKVFCSEAIAAIQAMMARVVEGD